MRKDGFTLIKLLMVILIIGIDLRTATDRVPPKMGLFRPSLAVFDQRGLRMRKDGFTLIKLLMVILIIGIVAAIVTSRFGDVRVRAVTAAMQSDLHHLRTAQEIYYHTNNFTYADNIADLTAADLFVPTEGVTVEINAAAAAWDASATHLSTTVTCDVDSVVSAIECSYQGDDRRIPGPPSDFLLGGQ